MKGQLQPSSRRLTAEENAQVVNPIYNEAAAERHFRELVELFKETLLSRGTRPLDPR